MNTLHRTLLLLLISLFTVSCSDGAGEQIKLTKRNNNNSPLKAKKGKPAKIVYTSKVDKQSSHVAYFDKKGDLRMYIMEQGDSLAVYSSDAFVRSTLIYEDDDLIWFENKRAELENRKVSWTSEQTNNLEFEKGKRYKHDFKIKWDMFYYPENVDSYGNWTQSVIYRHGVHLRFARELFYYDSNTEKDKEAVLETEAIIQRCDSIVEECTLTENTEKPKKRNFNILFAELGFLLKLLLPALWGFLACAIPGLKLRYNSKYSNSKIKLIIFVGVILIAHPVAKYVASLDYYISFWVVGYWILMLIGFAFGYRVTFNGRCPKCAAVYSKITDVHETKTTERTVLTREDGQEEEIEYQEKYDYEYKYLCRNCGHRWWDVF